MRLAFDNSSAVTNRIEVLNNLITDVWRQGILLSGRDQAVVNARIDGNTVGSASSVGPGGSGFTIPAGAVALSNRRGVEIETQANSIVNIEITNNSIRNVGTSNSNSALHIRSGVTDPAAGEINATVTNNTMSNTNAGNVTGRFRAETVSVGASAGDICLDLRTNTLEDDSKEYNLVHASLGTFRLEGPGGAVVTNANVEAQNTAGTGNVSGTVLFNNGANCPQPTF